MEICIPTDFCLLHFWSWWCFCEIPKVWGSFWCFGGSTTSNIKGTMQFIILLISLMKQSCIHSPLQNATPSLHECTHTVYKSRKEQCGVGFLFTAWWLDLVFLGIPRIIDKMLKGYKQVQKFVVLEERNQGISRLPTAISKAFQSSVSPESESEEHKRFGQFLIPIVYVWMC